ncbi:hypothetical protein ACLGIH_19775 [Streptomyces sp. HMX87]|uniref:hypothetical protein n=1 Tax=Streptomyces sp. HMX87 TaxID=3390849 RepID=UPI003A875788
MTDCGQGACSKPKALAAAGFGLLLVLLSTGLFATVPSSLTDKRAYDTAPACPVGTASESCTTTVPAVVAGKEEESRVKSHLYWLLLAERGRDTAQRVCMAGADPVYDAVHAGDEVMLTYWRGEVRTVRFGALTQETQASPADDWRGPLAFGLLLLPLGLGLLWGGWWHRRPSPAAQARPRQLTVVGLGAGAQGCVGFVGGMTGSGVPGALLITAAGAPAVAALARLWAWRLRRRADRAADTSDIVPVPPAGKQCVRATVHGDVPYSVDGFDHLVVGDGRPAATPDPDGRVARRALPQTLTVQRVRPLRHDDPEDWQHTFRYEDGVVIECRDGDRTVRITTARRDAPLVLGALAMVPGEGA